jgi:hypothetical protein
VQFWCRERAIPVSVSDPDRDRLDREFAAGIAHDQMRPVVGSVGPNRDDQTAASFLSRDNLGDEIGQRRKDPLI